MPKGSRWEEIIETIPESNEIGSSETTDPKATNQFLEKIKKIHITLARLIKGKETGEDTKL